ncbi:MAG: response regulator [Candidatus Binataceae bacterium]|jgi:DNA-binding response OmpR family regulator
MSSKRSRVRRKPRSGKILIVEGNDAERQIAAEFWRKDGYVVLEASTRWDAIRILETEPSDAESTTWRPVEAVVTALTVPELEDGFALLEWMRDYGPDVPVVVVSAATTEEAVNRALELGAFEYVMKPCGAEELLSAVKNAIAGVTPPGYVQPERHSVSRRGVRWLDWLKEKLIHAPDTEFDADTRSTDAAKLNFSDYDLTDEEQREIEGLFNLISTLPEGEEGSWYVRQEDADTIFRSLAATALSEFAARQVLLAISVSGQERMGLLSKALHAGIQAFSMHHLPIYQFDAARYAELLGNSDLARRYYQEFLDAQRTFQPSEIDRSALKLRDAGPAIQEASDRLSKKPTAADKKNLLLPIFQTFRLGSVVFASKRRAALPVALPGLEDNGEKLAMVVVWGAHACTEFFADALNFSKEDRNKERQKHVIWWSVLSEFVYCFLHLTDRFAFQMLGPEKRDPLVDRLGPLVAERFVENYVGHWPKDRKDQIKSDFYDTLNVATQEYARCRELVAEPIYSQEGVCGKLAWRVGDTAECFDPLPMVQIAAAAAHFLVELDLPQLVEDAASASEAASKL